jgi:transglutaminase-like putative cysteine protease
MHIRIAHSSVYRYDPPAAGVIQVLRLTPRNHEGQYVLDWRIDVTRDALLAAHEDAFGNITHVFTADGPFSELSVEVDGQVETQNTDGVVRGAVERFPPSLFLRDTALTQADTAIREFGEKIRAVSGGEVLAELHALLDRLYEDMSHENMGHENVSHENVSHENGGHKNGGHENVGHNADSSHTATTAAQAFALRRGGSRDLTHIFIAVAHSLGIPARYVGGYFRRPDNSVAQHAGHAWAEAYVSDLGWVGFDPTNGFCPTDAHVRIAIGLDSLGAAPVRGTRLGAGTETLAVAIKVGQ